MLSIRVSRRGREGKTPRGHVVLCAINYSGNLQNLHSMCAYDNDTKLIIHNYDKHTL